MPRPSTLSYIAGAASAQLARKATSDAYNYAKRAMTKKKSVHTRISRNPIRPVTRNYNSFRDVLYSLKYKRTIPAQIQNGNTNTLRYVRFTDVDQYKPTLDTSVSPPVLNDATAQLTTRSRQLIWAKACKFNLYMENRGVRPCMYRWAVLQWKYKSENDSSLTDLNTDFFRNEGDGINRVVNWDLVNQFEKYSNLINRQKFTVFAEGRGMLSESSLGTTETKTGNGRSFVNINRQIKLNHKIEYDGTVGTQCRNPIILCYWITDVNDSSGTGSGTPSMNYYSDTTLMFQE